jgi:aspartate aminotransferase-like enzyme
MRLFRRLHCEITAASLPLAITCLRSRTAGNKDRARAYHHTAPISLIFGLYEGIRLALDEGLDARCVH